MARNQDSTTTRTEDAWWSWHDEDYSRHYATTEEAEEACRAWVAGESDVGPALDSTARYAIVFADSPNYGDVIEIHASRKAAYWGAARRRGNYIAIELDAELDASVGVGDRVRTTHRRLDLVGGEILTYGESFAL